MRTVATVASRLGVVDQGFWGRSDALRRAAAGQPPRGTGLLRRVRLSGFQEREWPAVSRQGPLFE